MSRFTTCGLTIMLACAPAALAVDGVVLINQSTITNGLTGCPTGGTFPIIICQSGSYRLSGNLTVPDANTSAIVITTDNVTIDLNGFSILGPTVCSGSPLNCSPSGSGAGIFNPINNFNSNIVVINGQIKGMGGTGINLFRANRTRVENITASSNGGTGIAAGVHSLVSSCIATSNGGFGIFSDGPSVVTGNTVIGNNSDGINTEANMVISGNSVVSNGGHGIAALCSSLISGNLAFLNTGGNILPSGQSCVLVNNAP